MVFVFLFDPDTTEQHVLVSDGYLQRRRAGGTFGIRTNYMSREDAAVISLFGSSWQVGAQMLALDAVNVYEFHAREPRVVRR